MSDSDSFLREVNEAVRQDRYKQLWDRYGVYVLGVAALIVVGVAGHRAWSYWQERQAAEAGAKYTAALSMEAGPDAAQAREMLTALAEQGPHGYRVLARFQLAAAEAKAGEVGKAVASYDALAKDPGVDPILQGNAAIQSAALRLDKADYAEMEQRLKGLIDSNSPWRFSARELLGLSAYRLNDMREAERQFSTLIGDQGTPPNLRERADMMLALIVGTPKPSSTTTN